MNQMNRILKQHYGIEASSISPLKGGWSALAYGVKNQNQDYFLKVYEKSRASTKKYTALIDQYIPITRWLLQQPGLQGRLLVPLLTVDGKYKCEDQDYIYLLYYHIDGNTIGDQPLTQQQVEALGQIVSALHCHGEEIPFDTEKIRETFELPFLASLQEVLYKEILLLPHLPVIEELISKIKELQQELNNRDVRLVLCHTDLHNWNLMESNGELLLIDWEGLKLAPPEADLIFFTDTAYDNQFLEVYRRIHRNFTLNPKALSFYQIRRRLEDLWEWLEQLLYDDLSQEEKAKTIKILQEELEKEFPSY